MTDPAVEAIARRVAELLADHVREPARLLHTHDVARMLAVSEEWVREHAEELGGIRVGDGPKGALRFDRAKVRAALERRRIEGPGSRRRRAPGPKRRSLGLLPASVPVDLKEW